MSKANRTLDEAVKLIKSIEISETFNAEVDLQLDIIEAIYQLQYKLERGYEDGKGKVTLYISV